MIRLLTGSDLGVARTEDYMVLEWSDGAHRVVFSFCQQGEGGVDAHFAAERGSLRFVKPAIMDFIKWAFWALPWSEVILAKVEKASVARVVEKCGFDLLCKVPEGAVYTRVRYGIH